MVCTLVRKLHDPPGVQEAAPVAEERPGEAERGAAGDVHGQRPAEELLPSAQQHHPQWDIHQPRRPGEILFFSVPGGWIDSVLSSLMLFYPLLLYSLSHYGVECL